MLNQLSIYLPNKPGVLANFFELLMKNKIYIRSMTVAETEEYGLLLLLVDQYEACSKLLEEQNFLFSVTKVIAVRLTDNISKLYEIAKTLGSNNVNIEYLYTTLIDDQALIVLRLDNNDAGAKILKENGFIIVDKLLNVID